ncbi:tyrosine-type recombinase/integrase [Alistipes sp. dk3620]|uniref:site-specific integrase n=1 Tax=unclassified Alistipes TaxID=2608932 RepID=UPI00129560D1|nr:MULTISPECIES: site-specific integrase [unclassified Alistipes]MQX26758.1 tyrosine-type recombinase/integrase [Alistipes sp. dk3620]QGA24151.1 tyrosine-type recombinase/integrase [Alistipes sp. dk3624]
MKSTFRILFLARWELQKENGQVPLCVRITIDGERVKFSLKSEVSGKIWDPKSGRAKGQTKEALQLNRYLDSIKGQMITHYHRLCEANEVVTATMVRDAFLGTDVKNNTLLTVFEEFNDRQEKLIGIDLAQSTFNKYDLTYRRLKEFIKVKMRKNDILLCQVDRNFVMDFEAYLKIEYKLDTNSSEKLMRIFKRITTMCFKNGQMPKDPFCNHKLKKVKKDRGYLTKSELEKIIDFKPDNKRLEKVRDIFLFCCFTGFDYSTTAALAGKNIVTDDEGSLWIETHRIKTGTPSKVKLLDIPLFILKKYELRRDGNFLLPVMSNAKYNLYLKEIASICGIEKRVTSHLARHTFATTVTYANGVSIESISKMLGHTKLSTTQIYARIVDKTVSNEMDKLAEKLLDTKFCANL